ncbi:hypothetical protein KW511_13100, partial [Vibrio fluvialis]|nr:hypothetical protein [Vibrio fluvialis]
MTSPLMKPTLVGRDTLHELDQPLKKLAYVSNHWGPLLLINSIKIGWIATALCRIRQNRHIESEVGA